MAPSIRNHPTQPVASAPVVTFPPIKAIFVLGLADAEDREEICRLHERTVGFSPLLTRLEARTARCHRRPALLGWRAPTAFQSRD